jgi:hypothetical protein
MKKFLVAIFALAVVTSVATAGIGVLWTVGYGAYDHNAANVVSDPSPNQLLANYGAIWQLIYAGPNNAIEAPDASNVAGGYVNTGPTGDDIVWRTRVIPMGGNSGGVPCAADGTTWDTWMVWTGTGDNGYVDLAWSTAGSVYQRVFETPISGPPAVGSWYYDSPLLALNTGFTGGGAPLQDFPLDNGQGGFKTNQQIPEPATMGLLGLGALVMAIRRRRS